MLGPRAVLHCMNVGIFLGRTVCFLRNSEFFLDPNWPAPDFLTILIQMLCNDPKDKFVWSYFPFFFFFFSLPCVHLFLSKDEPLYIFTKALQVCLLSKRKMCLGISVLPHMTKQGGKKTCGFQHHSPQGRRETFDKMSALLKSPSKSRCRFHRGLIF